MIAFGVDPGFAFLGLGVLEVTANRTRVLHLDTFTTSSKDADEHRLDRIADYLADMADRYAPDVIGYENQAGVEVGMQRMREADPTKAGTNYSSRRVHEVSGIIRCVARMYDLPCYCLAPNTVKVAVLGKGGGRAKKDRVKAAVRAIFRVHGSEHAADGVAIAVGAVSAHRRHELELRRSCLLIH